jgi:hypothetical protein
MILPNKYEDLKNTPLVIGKDIILLLRKKNFSLFDLYSKLSVKINIDTYFDILTFLYAADLISFNNNIIYLNDTKKTLHGTD